MLNALKEMLFNFCNFSGRTSRRDFWLAVLGVFIISLILGYGGGFVLSLGGVDPSKASAMISSPWALITLLPILSMQVRRLHDINKSGWWILINFLPIIGSFILLVFFCMPSVRQGNRY